MKPGDRGPELRIEDVSRAMFVRYAGASGDFNPIHWNDEYARSAGYPGVFGMGMFTAGCLATFLTRWMGAGTVRRYRVRFTGQVWPGETLVCSGVVTRVYEVGGESRLDCDLTVANADGDSKITGAATCAIADQRGRLARSGTDLHRQAGNQAKAAKEA